MEKRVLLAALISAIFLSWYAQLMTKWAPPRPQGPLPVTAQGMAVAKNHAEHASNWLYPMVQEEVVFIESESLRVEIGRTSGDVRGVTLKEFQGESRKPLQFMGLTVPILRIHDGTDDPRAFTLVSSSEQAVGLETAIDGKKYYISYELSRAEPILELRVRNTGGAGSSGDNFQTIVASWSKADALDDRGTQLEIIALTESNGSKRVYKRFLGQSKVEKIVPRGTTIFSLAERYFCLSMKPESGGTLSVSQIPSNAGTIAGIVKPQWSESEAGRALAIYFGPRDYFYLKKAGFEAAFPIGAVGKLGLVLLAFLGWIAGSTRNYGVAIIIFSGLISCATAPFTILSIRSMKKMRDLKPHIDKMMAQHKGDAARANKEIFALYREHRVSPLSGCLPMLLQMPVFIALFQAISHFIALRGASFLWIKDLSLPDRAAVLPFSVPLLGNEINLLPIIMAAVMYLQSRASQGSMPTDKSNPAMALMSGPFMSVIFGVMFYHFQSGLVLYWLTNSVFSVICYRMAGSSTVVPAR